MSPLENVNESDLREYHAEIHARHSTLLGIYIVNWLLTLLTVGIYSFWGKVKARKYLYGQSEFVGERFAYHGTGKELFFGFLKLLIFLLPLALFLIFFQNPIAFAIAYLGFFALLPLALFGSRRYQMSRTSWRGIHFSFRGSLKDCYRIFITGGLLLLVTFGFYFPYFRVNLRRYWMNHTYYGNVPFHYNGKGVDLFHIYIRFVLISIGLAVGSGLLFFIGMTSGKIFFYFAPFLYILIYLGLAVLWMHYEAKEYCFHWEHTFFDQAPFTATMTGWDLLSIRIKHIIFLVLTLGFAFAWTKIDKLRFLFEKTALLDTPDFAEIHWDERGPTGSAAGESMADALDVGGGFDLGI